MRGVFQRVTRGQALQIPAEVWNQFGVMAFGGERFDGASAEAMGRANLRNKYDATQVIVFNDTGSDLPQWGIVSLGAPTFIPSASGEVQQTRTVLTVVAPSAGAFFGVCQNAIPDGACGTAIVAGVTPCILNVTASGDTHADATTSTTELTTGTSGRAEIIYKASGTGAGKLGVVFVGNVEASVPAIEYETFRLTSDLSFNGPNNITTIQEITGFTKASGGTTTYLEFPSAGVWRVDAVITGLITSPPSSGNVSVPAILMGRIDSYSSTMLVPTSSIGGGAGVIADGNGKNYSDYFTGYGSLTLSAYFEITTPNTKAITLEAAILPAITSPAGNIYAIVQSSNTYASGLTQIGMFKVSE